MKTFLVLLALLTASVATHACAAEEPEGPTSAPTVPPPFVPDKSDEASPSKDLDDLMKLLTGIEEEEKPAPKSLECKTRPCVFGYRFSDGVNDESVEKFEKFMVATKAAKPDFIMIEINTPGGSISSGHEMSRLIENSPATVACVVDGTSYSMGMYILQSCDVRVMTKRSSLMVHQAALIARPGTRLTQTSMDNMQTTIRVVTRGYIEWVAHRMNVSVANVLARVSNGGEWFLNWDEALKVGAVDKVIDGPPEAYFQQLTKGKP